MSPKPAALGGRPVFDQPIPFAQPTIDDHEHLLTVMRRIFESGRLTEGALVKELEDRVAERFGVDHCVAVSSCTSGLMLIFQALDLDGPVIVPSFTFVASANAVAWNRLPVHFADCSPATWCVRPSDVNGSPAAILGVHVSGVPCDVRGLQAKANELGAELVFDAAHGAGATLELDGRTVPVGGFGRAEVFSLTPTKVMSGAEGGMITTNDPDLADRLRMGRNYGNPGNYDTRFPGLNARLSELHAAVALASLERLEERVEHRGSIAARYRDLLGELPGVRFQQVPHGSRSSYKDFTVLIDADSFGCSRDVLAAALKAEGVDTRKYYSPPVHRQEAFRDHAGAGLPVTDLISGQVLSLPIWSHMPLPLVTRICETIEALQANSRDLEQALS